MVPTHVRDPEGELPANQKLVPYRPETALPAGAVDTALRTGEFTLFTDGDPRAIYAVGPDHVERWPAHAGLRPDACG